MLQNFNFSIFDDVAKNFESWTANDLKLYIFSSGSVDAQKLLFKYSQEGDLLKHISGHYDTTVGPKQESESYKKIMSELGLKEDEIVFLTDILKGEFELCSITNLQSDLF